MPVKIIVDPGSCHMAHLDWAIQLVHEAKQAGADAIKFQLFENLPPNIALPRPWLTQIVNEGEKVGIEVFASAFDESAMDLLLAKKCRSVKFAYSRRDMWKNLPPNRLAQFDTVYISGDVLTRFPEDFTAYDPNRHETHTAKVVRLYCDTEYGKRYEIDFDGMFPKRFDGASLHELGTRQTLKAIAAGAKYIERHFTLDNDEIDCADHMFALRPQALADLVAEIKDEEELPEKKVITQTNCGPND